jgi:hypothetical protein
MDIVHIVFVYGLAFIQENITTSTVKRGPYRKCRLDNKKGDVDLDTLPHSRILCIKVR